ncbi:MAG: hypothetical protein IT204_12470 [Fimbriimonadaceae bacterium]|nr:hypothetical protein [Fimbriimonadaceae bacterium]
MAEPPDQGRDDRLGALLRAAVLPDPPRDLRGRVLGSLSPRGARRWAWRLAPLAATAALLAVVWRPLGPVLPTVSPADLRAGGYVQQHALAGVADPLADATALHLLGTLELRAAVAHQAEWR